MRILRATTVAAMLFMLTALSGCGLLEPATEPIPMPPAPYSTSLEPLPIDMTVDVYWDATISMQGFTTLAAGNFYRMLPDILSDMSSFLGEVRFFRFGAQVVPIERKDYRRLSMPEDYTETVTSFGNVVDAADPEHLSVVVTDLFESDADWSNVTQKLREKYFSRHLSVAIIGVKNSFNGEIFDVGLNASAFQYDSGADSSKFRPFYMFLMGSEPQIRAFLERWKEQQLPSNEMRYVVFSEHFTTNAGTFRVADAKEPKNLFIVRKLSKTDERLQEIGISDPNEEVQFVLPFKPQPYPDACIFKTDELERQIKVFALTEENIWQEQTLNDAGDLVSFDDNLNLKLTFKAAGTLPPGRIGLLQVRIIPTRRSVELPQWISDWDMGYIDAAPEQFDGGKTVNLQRIAASLRDSLLSAEQAPIADLYIVVDGR